MKTIKRTWVWRVGLIVIEWFVGGYSSKVKYAFHWHNYSLFFLRKTSRQTNSANANQALVIVMKILCCSVRNWNAEAKVPNADPRPKQICSTGRAKTSSVLNNSPRKPTIIRHIIIYVFSKCSCSLSMNFSHYEASRRNDAPQESILNSYSPTSYNLSFSQVMHQEWRYITDCLCSLTHRDGLRKAFFVTTPSKFH